MLIYRTLEKEISNFEAADVASSDPWHQTWLRALYNKQNALLCQALVDEQWRSKHQ